MDAAVLQMMVPGHMRQQDCRTRERMREALRRPGNCYLGSFEAIQTLVSKTDALRQWWELNLRTEFFSHKGTARAMRKHASGISGW
jgi:hypothetical protein